MRSGMGRSQAAVDFISSYGFALLIIAMSIYVVFQLGVFNYSNSPQYCYSPHPFACVAYTVNSTGSLTVLLSQSSGGIMTITGAACSTVPNTTRVGPQYGNVNIAPATGGNAVYYPNSGLSSPIVLYSGSSTLINVNCYSGSGQAKAPIGNTFTGYLWLSYTFSGLPSTYNAVSRAASFSAKVVSTGTAAPSCSAAANTLATAGGPYTVIAPSGCGHVAIQLWGAGGGGGDNEGGGAGTGGGAGYAYGTNAVTPGSTLYVWVGGGGVSYYLGGNGGSPGGGTASPNTGGGGGAGGCSAVTTSSSSTWSTAASSAIIVAAGGGGAGTNSGNGGAGGGATGAGGSGSGAGGGGTQSGGGSSGGSAYNGGGSSNDGGGGGCGYYGGGGASSRTGGGGGGSSNVIAPMTSSGVQSGSGSSAGGSPTGGVGGGGAGSSSGQSGEVVLTWSS